jgi:hypothetical protein
MRGIDSVSNLSSVLAWSGAGFTVYNPTADTMTLCVPPTPTALSKIGLVKKLAKKTKTEGWAVIVSARSSDGSRMSPVYCGYNKEGGGVSYYPVAPSFADAYVGVADAGTKQVWGHAMLHAMNNGGCAYLLAFCNTSSKTSRTISYRVENADKLPKGMAAGIYNAEAGKYEDLSSGTAQIGVGPESKGYRWLLVGSAEYLSKAGIIAPWAQLAFVGTYPNPFGRYVHIRYSLPYDGVNGVKFGVYDMRGKQLWQREIRDIRRYGQCETVWDGRRADGRQIASGVYVIRMTAMSNRNRTAVFEQKMTFMP